MLIPRDLTHLDFGIRYLTMGEASMAASFVWKGQQAEWVVIDLVDEKIIRGRDPQFGAQRLTISVDGQDRCFPCPSLNNPDGLRYKFTIIQPPRTIHP